MLRLILILCKRHLIWGIVWIILMSPLSCSSANTYASWVWFSTQIIELCLLTDSASSSGWLVESPDVDVPLPVSPLVVWVVTILKVAEVGRTPDVQSGGALPETERDRLVPGTLKNQLSNYLLKIVWNHLNNSVHPNPKSRHPLLVFRFVEIKCRQNISTSRKNVNICGWKF